MVLSLLENLTGQCCLQRVEEYYKRVPERYPGDTETLWNQTDQREAVFQDTAFSMQKLCVNKIAWTAATFASCRWLPGADPEGKGHWNVHLMAVEASWYSVLQPFEQKGKE